MGLLFIMSRLLSGQYFKVSPKPSGDFLSKMKNGSPGIYREAKTTPTGQKPMRQHRLLRIGIIVTLIILTAFTLAVWMFGWDWTGFNGGYSQITITSTNHGTTTVTAKPPGKTLWDWMQLLIIPIVLAVGGLWFNQIQKDREQKAADERTKTERDAAEQRAKTEREIVLDNQREAALQAYFDKISELLLKEHLGELKPKYEEVRKIARVRTLTLLPRLDGKRKGSVLQFLQESNLIVRDKPIVDLNGADLSHVELELPNQSSGPLRRANLSLIDLHGADLSQAYLQWANLSHADLRGANLQEASLWAADLSHTDLRYANLQRADLNTTILEGTNLITTTLSEADLRGSVLRGIILGGYAEIGGVDLREVDLKGITGITYEELEEKGALLQGATMPD